MQLKWFFFCLVFIISISVSAQDKIKISGVILDGENGRGLSGISVIHNQSNLSYITDYKGRFSLYCDKNDDIFLFYPGYKTMRFSMKDSVAKNEYFVQFTMEVLTATTSKPAIVKPKKTIDEIAEERKKLGQIPKELETPQIYYTSPISALYEMLSDRARERDKLRKQIIEDNRKKIFRELFDYYKENKLFELPDEYYDEFIDYLGLPIDFLRENSDYEITRIVLSQYKRFGIDKGFIR